MRIQKTSFTLIELVVTMVVISVLASLALVSYNRTMRIENERQAILQLSLIHTANRLYYDRAKQYLPAAANLDAINAGLSLSLSANGMVYTYRRINPNYYDATASFNGEFTVLMDSSPEHPWAAPYAVVPCCSAGACPTLPTCS